MTFDNPHLAHQEAVPVSPPCVLVVDDAPTVRLYHGSILRGAGFDIAEAGNGFEALEMALNTSYDLMVVDVNMPQMDGYSLVTRLRSAEVRTSCPILMISTEAGDIDCDTAYRAGANLFLTKPVAPGLLQRVAKVLTAQLPSAWLEPREVQPIQISVPGSPGSPVHPLPLAVGDVS